MNRGTPGSVQLIGRYRTHICEAAAKAGLPDLAPTFGCRHPAAHDVTSQSRLLAGDKREQILLINFVNEITSKLDMNADTR